MKYFHSEGGNNRPHFPYRIKVAKCTTEMHKWCTEYPVTGNGYFQRFHVEWSLITKKDYDVVQFEWEEPAIMFALKFGVKP